MIKQDDRLTVQGRKLILGWREFDDLGTIGPIHRLTSDPQPTPAPPKMMFVSGSRFVITEMGWEIVDVVDINL